MICENCGLPAAPHKIEDCFKELVQIKKLSDHVFDAAVRVVAQLGDPMDIEDKKLQSAVLDLDLATWNYAK